MADEERGQTLERSSSTGFLGSPAKPAGALAATAMELARLGDSYDDL